MAEVRELFHPSDKVHKAKKDPLAETKKQERLEKDIFKAQRTLQKERKLEEMHLVAEAAKLERAWNPVSKRAQKEIREKEHHDQRAAEGQMCEHGVWRCRICFPHKTGK